MSLCAPSFGVYRYAPSESLPLFNFNTRSHFRIYAIFSRCTAKTYRYCVDISSHVVPPHFFILFALIFLWTYSIRSLYLAWQWDSVSRIFPRYSASHRIDHSHNQRRGARKFCLKRWTYFLIHRYCESRTLRAHVNFVVFGTSVVSELDGNWWKSDSTATWNNINTERHRPSLAE